MANKYSFGRDSITVNGKRFPAEYAVMVNDSMTVEITATVDNGERVVISVPPSDKQHAAALKAAQTGLTLDAATAPEDGGSASRDGDSATAAADRVQADGSTAAAAAPEDGGSVPEALVYATEIIGASRDGGSATAAADRVQADGGPDGSAEAATAPEDGGSASRDGDSATAAADRVQADGGRDGGTAAATATAPEDGGSASRDGDSTTAAAEIPAPEMAAAAATTAETVDYETTAAAADNAPAGVETVNNVDNDPANVETVQAATAEATTTTATAEAPDAETINNEEDNTMLERNIQAEEAVKAAAAAEVEEMTTAEADPKAAHGPIPEKTFKNEVIAGNGWSIVFDNGNNRTRVIISDAAKATARPIVEAAGFYYSKTMDSWNKKLTFRAYRAAQALAEKLRAVIA